LSKPNVKIAGVLSDVFGVSGQRMILGIAGGKSTPEEIAGLL
jgi:hypothetical protein